MSDNGSQETPLLRIVKGNPEPDELAALVTVVSALASTPAGDKAQPTSEWAARHRLVRATHRHGPGAWRASAR